MTEETQLVSEEEKATIITWAPVGGTTVAGKTTKNSYVGRPTLSGTFIIADATVVDVRTGETTPHRDVEIVDGKIARIGETGGDHSDIQTIDGSGKFLIPGFVDSHAHPLNTPSQTDGAYALMLTQGVTGFRQMSGTGDLLRRRSAGMLPTGHGAPELLAMPGDVLTPMNASTSAQGRQAVRAQKAHGADFIKTAMTGRTVLMAVLDEAHRRGITVAGHLPADMDPRQAAQMGMYSMEHLGPGVPMSLAASSRENDLRSRLPAEAPKIPQVPLPAKLFEAFMGKMVINPAIRTSQSMAKVMAEADATYDEQKARTLARTFVEYGTWQCPTLIRIHTQQFPELPEHRYDKRLKYMAPTTVSAWEASTKKFSKLPEATRLALHRHWNVQLMLTRVFDEEGVPMLAGTDACGAGYVIPGFAMHDEFDLLFSAGLSPLHILQMATINAAQFFHAEDRFGWVGEGTHADLVLLEADPLDDVANLHRIAGVVRAGQWWDRSDLDAILERIEADPRTV